MSQKTIVCTENEFPKNATCIDIISFDIGFINMGVARIRYDFAAQRMCILNAMLMSIYNPFQMLNENDKESDEDISFPVDAYYATKPNAEVITSSNHWFSDKQFLSRKRARITDDPEQTLQYIADIHPQNTAKRRRTKLQQRTITSKLAKNWALIGSQLTLSLHAHEWISNVDKIDFVLLEQQDRNNPQTRAVCLSIVTFYETKRLYCPPQNTHNVAQQSQRNDCTPLWNLAPFIKICSATNKLGNFVKSMRNDWSVSSQSTCYFMTPVQIRKLLKKHFIPTVGDAADTSDYSKRKISSKDEITAFFCRSIIERARSLTFAEASSLPEKCPEPIIEKLSTIPVNAYAHWIVDQLGEKNNVTDALLQAFAWIQLCEPPPLQS